MKAKDLRMPVAKVTYSGEVGLLEGWIVETAWVLTRLQERWINFPCGTQLTPLLAMTCLQIIVPRGKPRRQLIVNL